MRSFRTDDIDLAPVIISETAQQPQITVDPQLSVFAFMETADLQRVVLTYAAGTTSCNARDLLRARRNLFNRIRGGRHER